MIEQVAAFLDRGGVAMWIIAALSVLTVAVTLWKAWRFQIRGLWRKSGVTTALIAWESGDDDAARATLQGRKGLRAGVILGAMTACLGIPDREDAKAETTRLASAALVEARTGLRVLELVATLAPLLGLFGTVLGMIEAFQALQEAGSRPDPAVLAGGIWEALLTTAAGMGVAIIASVAHAWFDGTVERIQTDLEDAATRVFVARPLTNRGRNR